MSPCAEAWSLFSGGKLLALCVLTGALAVGALVWPYDRKFLESVHRLCYGHQATARDIAWYLGTWGDYLDLQRPLCAGGLALWRVVTKSSAWRRAAIIDFLGATLAGLFDDFFRLTLGRPRPDAHMPDGFYGITYAFRGGFQSFPSGHAASVFGGALALLGDVNFRLACSPPSSRWAWSGRGWSSTAIIRRTWRSGPLSASTLGCWWGWGRECGGREGSVNEYCSR